MANLKNSDGYRFPRRERCYRCDGILTSEEAEATGSRVRQVGQFAISGLQGELR